MQRLPEKLLKLRKGHNLSQDFLARKLGIGIFEYMALENGRKALDKNTIDRIANIYEITSEELIDDEEEVRILNLGNKFSKEKRPLKTLEFYKKIKEGKYNTILFIGVVALVFLIAVVSLLPKSYNITVSMTNDPSNYLAANRDTVVFLNKSVNVKGKDNVYFGEDRIVKVDNGINYFVALTEDGKVKTSGLNVKYQKDIEKIKNAVDVSSGESHILILLNNGKVKCVGNNDYNQCEVNKWNKVSSIYTVNYGSIGKTDDGLVYTGKIPHVEKLNNLDFKQIEILNDTLYVLLNDGSLKVFGDNDFNLDEFDNLKEFEVEDDFIVGLKNDGTVVINIDNYLLSEKVKHFKNIKTIDASDSYLVVSDGMNVYGVGENNYNQFEELQIELKPLDPISNLEIEKTEDDVIITFDKVTNAQAYKLVIDELNINIKVDENKFVLPLSLFESDKKYIMMITAVNTYDLYLDSDTKHIVFEHTVTEVEKDNKEEDIVVVEIPFIVKNYIGETKEDFIAFLTVHDYDIEKLKESVVNDCENNLEIISISGIQEGEEITSSVLKEREISYKYCEVKEN